MGLFRPYQSNDAAQAAKAGPSNAAPDPSGIESELGKKAPTPSRRQAELERRARLHPTLSKSERRAREREITRTRQEEAMARDELRPEKVLLRNYVDSKWSFSEFSWPLLLLIMAIFLASYWMPSLALGSTIAIWIVMALMIIEVSIRWFGFRRVLDQRMPGVPRRGMLMYMASRMISMRRFRRPPTAIDRGAQY